MACCRFVNAATSVGVDAQVRSSAAGALVLFGGRQEAGDDEGLHFPVVRTASEEMGPTCVSHGAAQRRVWESRRDRGASGTGRRLPFVPVTIVVRRVAGGCVDVRAQLRNDPPGSATWTGTDRVQKACDPPLVGERPRPGLDRRVRGECRAAKAGIATNHSFRSRPDDTVTPRRLRELGDLLNEYVGSVPWMSRRLRGRSSTRPAIVGRRISH